MSETNINKCHEKSNDDKNNNKQPNIPTQLLLTKDVDGPLHGIVHTIRSVDYDNFKSEEVIKLPVNYLKKEFIESTKEEVAMLTTYDGKNDLLRDRKKKTMAPKGKIENLCNTSTSTNEDCVKIFMVYKDNNNNNNNNFDDSKRPAKKRMLFKELKNCDMQNKIHVGPFLFDPKQDDDICLKCGIAWKCNYYTDDQIDSYQLHKFNEVNKDHKYSFSKRFDNDLEPDGLCLSEHLFVQQQQQKRKKVKDTICEEDEEGQEHLQEEFDDDVRHPDDHNDEDDNNETSQAHACSGYGQKVVRKRTTKSYQSIKRTRKLMERLETKSSKKEKENETYVHVSHTGKAKLKTLRSSVYDPRCHFRDHLDQVDGIKKWIDESIIEIVRETINTHQVDVKTISLDQIKEFLKLNGLENYYTSVVQIKARLNNERPNLLTVEEREGFFADFERVLNVWPDVIKKLGTCQSLLRIKFILRKICLRRKWFHLLDRFPKLKIQEKHNLLTTREWALVCDMLDWENPED